MPYPFAQFPEQVWDGLTDNLDRVSLNSEVNPDNDDFQRMATEIIAAQRSGGATLFPPITVGGPITVTDPDGAEFPITTSGIFLVDSTGGALTIDLPAASQMTGKTLTFKKIDVPANAITLDGNSSETIDGSLTQIITQQYVSITIVSDGTEWFIL